MLDALGGDRQTGKPRAASLAAIGAKAGSDTAAAAGSAAGNIASPASAARRERPLAAFLDSPVRFLLSGCAVTG
jgi:hypothetical protein